MTKGRKHSPEMALYKCLCAAVVAILLAPNGCRSQWQDCGKGGRHLNPADGPWRAEMTNEDATPSSCSGSLISRHWVITSGACGMREDGTMVRLGRGKGSVTVGVSEVICQGLNPASQTSDEELCLVKLSPPVNFTEDISPVCIAEKGSRYSACMESYTSDGTNSPGGVKVPIVGPKKCESDRGELRPGKICAGRGVKRGAADSCMKNLGQPLLMFLNDAWTLVGLGGLDDYCPPPGIIRTYNDVSPFTSWIMNVTGLMRNFVFIIDAFASETDPLIECPIPASPKPPMHPSPAYPGDGGYRPWPSMPTYDGMDGMDDSIFVSGVSLVHSSPFIVFPVLILSLFCAD